MKTLKISFFLILGLLITLSSCEKDEQPQDNNNPVDNTYTFEIGAAKTASFFGTIIDENHDVISGVAVSVGSSSAVTDANGVFFIENASVNQNHAYIKAEKSGFFLGSRSVVPTDGVNTIKIMMLDKQNIGNFDANSGGTVSGNGLTIEFQDGVVDASGNAYTGVVNVAAKYIDPESADFFDYMPGNLIGADANGGRYLQSFGMAAIELTDASGNELQPAENKEAVVSFPLSSGLLTDAASTIPLWHFDEAKGYWVLEGEASLDGNVYKASVSHFSFWNCDIPTSYVILDGQILDGTGAGLPGARVAVVSAGFGTGIAFTDAAGEYSGIVPAGDPLTLEVYLDCGAGYTLVHTEVLGSLASDFTVADITVPGLTSVIGNVVDCSSLPVANGYVSYNDGLVAYLAGGDFNFSACDGSSVDVQVYDLDAFNESGIITETVSGASYDFGTIMACDAITEYISWSIDGDNHIATNNFNIWEQGTYAGFSANTPNNFNFNSSDFAGVGVYTLDNTYIHSINADEMASIESGSITMNITSHGLLSGDLIEGDFSGTITGISPIDSSTVTQSVSGLIHFFRD